MTHSWKGASVSEDLDAAVICGFDHLARIGSTDDAIGMLSLCFGGNRSLSCKHSGPAQKMLLLAAETNNRRLFEYLVSIMDTAAWPDVADMVEKGLPLWAFSRLVRSGKTVNHPIYICSDGVFNRLSVEFLKDVLPIAFQEAGRYPLKYCKMDLRQAIEKLARICFDREKVELFLSGAFQFVQAEDVQTAVNFTVLHNNVAALRGLAARGAPITEKSVEDVKKFVRTYRRGTDALQTLEELLVASKISETRRLLFDMQIGLAEHNFPVLVILTIYDQLRSFEHEPTTLYTRWEMAKIIKQATPR